MTPGVSKPDICRGIRQSGVSGHWTTPHEVGTLEPFKGAYLLLLHLDRIDGLRLPPRISGSIAPGWFIYAGSAHGPGGVRRRLSRHFRPDKKIHWHIDHLTARSDQSLAFAVPDAGECDLSARLIASGAFVPVIAGFGSSDCKSCTSHLLQPCRACNRPPDPMEIGSGPGRPSGDVRWRERGH